MDSLGLLAVVLCDISNLSTPILGTFATFFVCNGFVSFISFPLSSTIVVAFTKPKADQFSYINSSTALVCLLPPYLATSIADAGRFMGFAVFVSPIGSFITSSTVSLLLAPTPPSTCQLKVSLLLS